MATSPTWSRISSKPISRCVRSPTSYSSTRSSVSASNHSGSAFMPLVKGGKITNDTFAAVADDAALPEGGDVLVSAARFLQDPDSVLQRAGKVGVIWPNNRDVDDLMPHLQRLATVALVFPSFRD